MSETAAPVGETQTRESAGVPARFLLAVSAVFLGWSAAHVAIVAALLAGVVPGGWLTLVALYGLFVVVPLVVLLRTFRERAYPGAFTRLFVLRPFWYVQLGIPIVSIPSAVAWLAGLPFGRAVAWGRVAALAALAFAVVFYAAGWWGSRRLVVRHVRFEYPDLPPSLDGMTIAQLSDLHVGPHTSRRFLDRIVRMVRDAEPDLIAHTGDQVDDYGQDVRRFAEVFGPLKAPLGVYAIPGNHDVYAGWAGVRAGLEAAGMRVLVNDAEPVRRGDAELWIVGTGDPAGAQRYGGDPDAAPDIERALSRVPPGAFTLALAHNPALWPPLADRGAHLTLSGHTHHGQLSIPGLKWSLASPFLELAMGEYARGLSRLYVHPGTNHWGLPMRLGAWPEVAIITLKRAT